MAAHFQTYQHNQVSQRGNAKRPKLQTDDATLVNDGETFDGVWDREVVKPCEDATRSREDKHMYYLCSRAFLHGVDVSDDKTHCKVLKTVQPTTGGSQGGAVYYCDRPLCNFAAHASPMGGSCSVGLFG